MHKDSGGKITCRRQEKPLPFPEEQIHLAQTLERLEEALAEAGEMQTGWNRNTGRPNATWRTTGARSTHMKCSRTNFF